MCLCANLTKNIEEYIFYKSSLRELSFLLKKHNPELKNIISYSDEIYCYNPDAELSSNLFTFYLDKMSNKLNFKGDYYIIYSIFREFEDERKGADFNFLKKNFEILEYIPSMEDSQFFYAKIRIK